MIQIDDMGHRNNGAAQHGLLTGESHTDVLHCVLQIKLIEQHILQLGTEIVIGHLVCVYQSLHGKQLTDMLQRKYTFQDRDTDKVRDLVGIVELAGGAVDQSFLHVIADHGASDLHTAQGSQYAVDILCCLFQIKAYIGDLVPAGQMKIC